MAIEITEAFKFENYKLEEIARPATLDSRSHQCRQSGASDHRASSGRVTGLGGDPRLATELGFALGRLMHFYHDSPGFGSYVRRLHHPPSRRPPLRSRCYWWAEYYDRRPAGVLCTARRSRSTTTCRTRSATCASRSSPVFPPASPTFWK
jgi:hypothetical protein